MYHIIVNPAASSGTGLALWKEIRQIFIDERVQFEAHIPESPAETARTVRALTDNPEKELHLVVIGGDGTLNLVLQNIVSFEQTVLSCISTGSGNDFARNMRIAGDYRQAVRHLIRQPEEYTLDYGEAAYYGQQTGKKRFLISCGIGYDADICAEVKRSRLKVVLNKFRLGKLVYLCIGIKQIFTRMMAPAVLTFDGRQKKTVSNLFFSVGMLHEYEGGGVPFCPNANPTDGRLDVCLVEGMSRPTLLLAVILVYLKQHYRFRKIRRYRCRTLRIQTKKPEWFHIDGETPCRITRLTLTCRSGLRFQK